MPFPEPKVARKRCMHSSSMIDESIYSLCVGNRRMGCGGFGFWVLPVALRGPGSLSVKEPASSLPQIYEDASAKLSHMAFQPAGSLC